MSEIEEVPGVIFPEGMLFKLVKLLGIANMVKLTILLEDVISETGWGDVKIVVAEGKVQMLKEERSYKSEAESHIIS